jgi:hypothetical protein
MVCALCDDPDMLRIRPSFCGETRDPGHARGPVHEKHVVIGLFYVYLTQAWTPGGRHVDVSRPISAHGMGSRWALYRHHASSTHQSQLRPHSLACILFQRLSLPLNIPSNACPELPWHAAPLANWNVL